MAHSVNGIRSARVEGGYRREEGRDRSKDMPESSMNIIIRTWGRGSQVDDFEVKTTKRMPPTPPQTRGHFQTRMNSIACFVRPKQGYISISIISQSLSGSLHSELVQSARQSEQAKQVRLTITQAAQDGGGTTVETRASRRGGCQPTDTLDQ